MELYKLVRFPYKYDQDDATYNVNSLIFQNFNNRAIFFNTSISNFYCSNTHFYNCSCQNRSGAVYFDVSKGKFINNKICVISCNTGDHGHYSFGVVNQGTQSYHLSCFVNCGDQGNFSGVIMAFNGNQEILQTNTSHCKSRSYGAFSVSASPMQGNISFCNFESSTAIHEMCDFRVTKYSMTFCSLRNLSCGNGIVQIIYLGETVSVAITDCIFVNNSAAYLFYNKYPNPSILLAKNCYIEDSVTASVSASNIETRLAKFKIDYELNNVKCKFIPEYFLKIDQCSVCMNVYANSFGSRMILMLYVIVCLE